VIIPKTHEVDPMKFIEDLYPYLPDGRRLSECLADDSREVAAAGPEYAELHYRLEDCVRLAQDLELAARLAKAAVDAAVERAEDAEDALEEFREETARERVEQSLHQDGIIEDPDIDGGLLG
jgi:hypothetical protein